MITPDISPGFRQRFDEARNGGGGAFSFGNAVEFDGVNDLIIFDNIITITADVSISVWLYWDGTDGAFCGLDSGAKSFIRIKDATTVTTFFQGAVDHTVSALPVNTWFHFVFTREQIDGSTSEGIVYINSSPESNLNLGGFVAGTMDQLGAREGGIIPWGGRIDEFVMWQVTLTPAQVISLYNGGSGALATDVQAAPDIYLRMDESSGTNAPDTSGNGNNGTLTFFADPNSAWVAHT